MKTAKSLIALLICTAIIIAFIPVAAAAEIMTEGAYTIRSRNGLYLADISGSLGCSATSDNYIWHLISAGSGAFFAYAEDVTKTMLLDLNNDWDIEGNTVGIFRYTGYLAAQTWLFIPNDDGSYQIRTVHDSGRVVTENGGKQPTIQTYTGADSQKWTLSRVAADNDYTLFMNVVIGTTKSEIITHIAKNETNASLKNLLAANTDKHNMVEGEFVVLHLPNSIWAKYSDPKTLIDTYDSIYRAQLEMTGGKTKVYDGKLFFLTDHNPDAPYKYASGQLCAANLSAVENDANYWVAGDRISALWGTGHEIGHAMVNTGMGRLFEGYDGESWNNVLNVYSLGQVGLYNEARQWVNQYPGDYGYSNDKYIQYKGRDYDELNDEERILDILAVNTHIFVKLPMLLADNYGWEGMRKFFSKAAEDRAGGMSASQDIQVRIDYMIVNLSKAYNMDLSMLFDYWRVPPSESARRQIADLPMERVIAGSYSLHIVPGLNSASSWAHDNITEAYEIGLIPNTLQSVYTRPMTRAEFCALAAALYETVTGREITERKTFDDTKDVNVEKMAALGVVNGVGNNNFSPNAGLTREQAATMISRLAEVIGKPLRRQTSAFTDNSSVAPWAIEAVGQMQATGIMGGVGNNTFAPKSDYTREQSIVTMLRLYNIVK